MSDKIRFIESVFGPGKLARNSKNIDVKCPICDPKDPQKRKLAIRVDDDRNHCWTCGWRARTLAPLIKKYASNRLHEYVEKHMPRSSDASTRKRLWLEVEQPAELALPPRFRLIALASRSDPDALAAKRYVIEQRGLSERDLWYFRLGVSDDLRWRRRVIVPSFDVNGKLNYFVGRAIDRQRKPKYDNPNVDKLPIIFNELNVDWSERLVLCEGAFDMFKCGENVVPLLGSDLNEESALFNAILVNNTPIDLALDSDTWQTKTPKIAKLLSSYAIDVRVVDTRCWGDPGSMTKKQFSAVRETAKQLDWCTTFFERLNGATRQQLNI